jgi:hypothetical protein
MKKDHILINEVQERERYEKLGKEELIDVILDLKEDLEDSKLRLEAREREEEFE